MKFDEISLKRSLDIDISQRISIRKVTNGYNIRILKDHVSKKIKTKKKKKSKLSDILFIAGRPDVCSRCGKIGGNHVHHIIPLSAGGKDDNENLIFLCQNCHTGENGIHNGKWKIDDIISLTQLKNLRIIYGVIK